MDIQLRKSSWDQTDRNLYADGGNEAIYEFEPGPPIKVTYRSRTGSTVLGSFPSIVQAKEAAIKHRDS